MTTQTSSLGSEAPQSAAAVTAVFGLQRQLEALRSWQREQDALLQRLAAESAEAASRAAVVRQREVEVGELARDLERRERQLEARREALAAEARQLEKERTDLASAQGAAEAARLQLAEQSEQVTARALALDARHADMQRERETLARASAGLDRPRAELRPTDAETAVPDPAPPAGAGPTEPAGPACPGGPADLAARRARLRRYARLLHQRRRAPATSAAGGANAVDDLLVQRQLLLDAQRFLAETERQMMGRWAVDRGWRLALCGALFLAGLAVASYAAAHQVAPPLWRATMALGYGASAGPAASRPRPAAMLGDPVLARTVAELAERGMRPFDGPQALRRDLGEHLTLAWSDPATLAMSYTGENQSLALFMLEALGEALGADPATGGAGGTDQRPLVVQAAAVDPRPAADRRWSVAAQVFAVGTALTALAGLVLARRLARRSRLLDVGFGRAAILELGDESRWAQAPRSAGSSTG